MRPKNTKPELELRRALRDLGLRYRLHRRDLPGTPDIVFGTEKLAVFVHGCYWHRHAKCVGTRLRADISPTWAQRFNAVVSRDELVQKELTQAGWEHLICWECDIKENPMAEAHRIDKRLARLRAN